MYGRVLIYRRYGSVPNGNDSKMNWAIGKKFYYSFPLLINKRQRFYGFVLCKFREIRYYEINQYDL